MGLGIEDDCTKTSLVVGGDGADTDPDPDTVCVSGGIGKGIDTSDC